MQLNNQQQRILPGHYISFPISDRWTVTHETHILEVGSDIIEITNLANMKYFESTKNYTRKTSSWKINTVIQLFLSVSQDFMIKTGLFEMFLSCKRYISEQTVGIAIQPLSKQLFTQKQNDIRTIHVCFFNCFYHLFDKNTSRELIRMTDGQLLIEHVFIIVNKPDIILVLLKRKHVEF